MSSKGTFRGSEFFTDEQLANALGFAEMGLEMLCPACGSAGECRAQRRPVTGDVVICFDCGAPIVVVAIIGKLLMLRKSESVDLEKLDAATAQQIRQNAEAISFLNGLGDDESENSGGSHAE